MREHLYSKTGCNIYDGNTIKSQPLGFWTRQDVLRYIVENQIPICSIYGEIRKAKDGKLYCTGEQRTGCMFCAFGAHLEKEPNRFQRMISTHPNHYRICINLTNCGIRYQDALELCGIHTTTWDSEGQLSLLLCEEKSVLKH